jgi:CheY-like chemotaxis protein
VELHSGKITAHSAGRNHGSTFAIELPLAKEMKRGPQANNSHPKQSPAELLPAAAGSRLVLLVEDHEITRNVLTQLLGRRNYKVIAVDSLAAAREAASQNKFDLLISDIGLPDGNGNDLMSELRQKYGITGIALTGYGMEADLARGKAAGFVTHLIKPVRIDALESALVVARATAWQRGSDRSPMIGKAGR